VAGRQPNCCFPDPWFPLMTARWLKTARKHTGLRALWIGCLLLGVLRVPLPVVHEHSALPGVDRLLSSHVRHCHADAPPTSWLDWHWHWLGWEEWCEAEGLEPGTLWTAPCESGSCAALAHLGGWRGPPVPGELPDWASGLSVLLLPHQGLGCGSLAPAAGQLTRHHAPGRVNPQSRTGLARC